VAKKRKRYRIIIIVLVFTAYFFLAARPVPREVVLVPKWINSLSSSLISSSSLESSSPEQLTISTEQTNQDKLLPFSLGTNFGYFDLSGQLIINITKTNDIYLSPNIWTEYDSLPSRLEIKDLSNETVTTIDNPGGYPVLLDDRFFVLGSEQNTLSEIGKDGSLLWKYDFGAPLTCIDVKAGLVLTGSVDGMIEVFNSAGERIFHFVPDGSRYGVILGCALSNDGSRIGIISGIDQQRFLLFERSGVMPGDYRVIYHEYLDDGFRRVVRILFVDDDRHIVFERAGGISGYNIRNRNSFFIPLDGVIHAIEDSGSQGYLFLVTAPVNPASSLDRNFIGIRFPQNRWLSFPRTAYRDAVFLSAPFKSTDVFIGRYFTQLFIGGGQVLMSFELEER
jgi:hypothetical protein